MPGGESRIIPERTGDASLLIYRIINDSKPASATWKKRHCAPSFLNVLLPGSLAGGFQPGSSHGTQKTSNRKDFEKAACKSASVKVAFGCTFA